MSMNKQDKYNPDVAKKYDQMTKERDTLHYIYSKQVYKGITNDFPTNVNTPEDLQLKNEEPDYDKIKLKMESAIRERENEKLEQEKLLKILSEQKIDKKITMSSNKTSNSSEMHQDMKNSYQKFNVDKGDKLGKEKLLLNDVFDLINKI
jgi:hypothetical protein